MLSQQGTMFLCKRHLAMMLLLGADVLRDNCGIRNAYAESAITFLPGELAAVLVHPLGGVRLEELDGLGQRNILRQMKQDMRINGMADCLRIRKQASRYPRSRKNGAIREPWSPEPPVRPRAQTVTSLRDCGYHQTHFLRFLVCSGSEFVRSASPLPDLLKAYGQRTSTMAMNALIASRHF